MDKVSASTTVNFSLGEEGELSREVALKWETEDAVEDDGEYSVYTFHRLFYSADTPLIRSIGGEHRSAGSGVQEYEEELSFTGSDTVETSRPGTTTLSVISRSRFYDATGSAFSPKLKGDADLGVITADQKCFGTIRVRYRASYRRYRFESDPIGAGCPTAEGWIALREQGQDPAQMTFFKTGMLIAIYPENSATVTIDPPACKEPPEAEDENYNIRFADDRVYPELLVEKDSDFLGYSGSQQSGATMEWIVPVRIYPAVGASVTVTDGRINKYLTGKTVKITEVLAFKGSSTVKTKYPVTSAPSFTVLTDLLDQYGGTANTVKTPGQIVTEVERPARGTTRNPRSRVVGDNEFVTVDFFGNVVAVYGAIKVTYTTTYDVYHFFPQFDWALYGWRPSFINANAGKRVGQLLVNDFSGQTT